MGIDVACRCGKKFFVKEELAGKRGKCPACGEVFVIAATRLPAYDVFISYSQRDKGTAKAICKALEGSGVPCWIAPRNIVPGKDWMEAIIDGINTCRVLVLVYTARSNVSEQVHREVTGAIEKDLTPIVFRLEDVPMTGTLEFLLGSRQWVDALTKPLDQHLKRLVRDVRLILQERGAVRPDTTAIDAVRESSSLWERVLHGCWAKLHRWRYLVGATGMAVALALSMVLFSRHGNDQPVDEGKSAPSVAARKEPPKPEVAHEGMVYVPPGNVHLGASEERLRSHARSLVSIRDNPRLIDQFVKACQEEKVQVVHVGGFWIDKYEVTNAEYGKFVQATNHAPPGNWAGGKPRLGTDDHPVTQVTYEDAAAYAAWAGKQLPTIAEWTRAFRGDDDRMYPWGDEWDAHRANVGQNTAFATGTSPVNVLPRRRESVRGLQSGGQRGRDHARTDDSRGAAHHHYQGRPLRSQWRCLRCRSLSVLRCWGRRFGQTYRISLCDRGAPAGSCGPLNGQTVHGAVPCHRTPPSKTRTISTCCLSSRSSCVCSVASCW